jgi:hypothetical protein
MRRGLKIRFSFSPTRMSGEYLRETYEMVTRSTERAIVNAAEAADPANSSRAELARTRSRR